MSLTLQSLTPIRWEYLCSYAETDCSGVLNEMGAKGWELVSIVRPHDGILWLYFKRPKA